MVVPPTNVGAPAGVPGMSRPSQDQEEVEFDIPWDVKRDFRTKALALGALETWVVLGLTVLCDVLFEVDKNVAYVIMIISLLGAAFSLTVFWFVRKVFPINYILLLITSILAGTFWAYTEDSIFNGSIKVPVQVCIILAITTTVWLLAVQLQCKKFEVEVLFSSLFIGWLIGSVANVAYMRIAGISIGYVVLPTAAVFMSSCVIVVGVAKPIIRCRTDDHMIVCLAITANLFILLSVPVIFFLLSLGGSGCSCDGGPDDENERERRPPAPAPAPAPAPQPPQPQPEAGPVNLQQARI